MGVFAFLGESLVVYQCLITFIKTYYTSDASSTRHSARVGGVTMEKRKLSKTTAEVTPERKLPIKAEAIASKRQLPIKTAVVASKPKFPIKTSVVEPKRPLPISVIEPKVPLTSSVVEPERPLPTAVVEPKRPLPTAVVEPKRKLPIQKAEYKLSSKRKLTKTTLALVALLIIPIAISFATFAALTNSPHVSPTDFTSPYLSSNVPLTSSANLGLYSDYACNNPMGHLDWGNLIAGGSVNQTIYIKNNSSGVPLTLSMTATNWKPASANGPITVTWDQEGTILSLGQLTVATVTLSVSPSAVHITNFSVQICITGTKS